MNTDKHRANPPLPPFEKGGCGGILIIILLFFAFVSCNGGKGGSLSPDISLYPQTPFTIQDASQLIGGPLAQGRVGDILLQNDQIRVIIQKPSKNAGLFSFGGIIIDADRIRPSGMSGRDEFGSLFPMINVEWTINYHDFEVTSTGEDGSPKILRAHGTIDVYDYLDLDFVKEAAQGITGQTLSFSQRFDDRSNPFEIYPDLQGIDPEVVTEYRLGPGKNYVRIDTTIKNRGTKDVSMPVGDVVNGGGELHLLIPGLGFSPEPMKQALGNTTALIYRGFDGVDVSYGYFYDASSFVNENGDSLPTSSLSFAGVTFVLLGEEFVKILPLGAQGAPDVHFTIPAGGEKTITRYFVVGDGSAGSVLNGGLDAMGVSARMISGTVLTANKDPISGAEVAVQKKDGGTIVTYQTDAKGHFAGSLPVGSDAFSKAVGSGQFHIIVDKQGYHKNGSSQAGSCDPEDFDLTKTVNVEVTCTLGETGFVALASAATEGETKEPIAARLTIVGQDPSPEGNKAGNFVDISEVGRPFGIVDVQYITAKGTFGMSGQSSLALEPGVYHFVFSHGANYGVQEKDVTVEANKTVTLEGIAINRARSTPGYISADFHMHSVVSPDSWIAPEKRVLAAAAEGMDVLQSSDHDFLFDYSPVISEMETKGLIPKNSFVASVIGDEITPNHYGHIQAFPLAVDSSSATGGALDWSFTPLDKIGTAPDYCMSPKEISLAVSGLPQEQVVQINHISDSPSGLPVASGWVTSRFYLEAGAGPLASYADPVERRLLPSTGGPLFPLPYGTSALVSSDFTTAEIMIGFDFHNAHEKLIESTLPTWFNFLNLGMILTATGSSDSHDELSNPMGLPRNFVAMDGPFNPDTYAKAINEHKLVVSAGPFVTVEAKGVDGEARHIGDTVKGPDVTLKILMSAPSWAWFDTVEIYANTEPIPIDDASGEVMSGTALDPEDFYKPYHVPKYAYKPLSSYKLSDKTLEGWKEENGVITAELTTQINVDEDTWVVVFVRGTQDTEGYKSLFPIVTNVLVDKSKAPDNFDPLNLAKFHADPKVGAFAFALANPIFIDADGDGAFTAKYVKEGTSPLNP